MRLELDVSGDLQAKVEAFNSDVRELDLAKAELQAMPEKLIQQALSDPDGITALMALAMRSHANTLPG